jgi:hypothetical protein
MGGKRKKNKRKPSQRSRPAASLDRLTAELEGLIDAGRGRKAAALARELCCHADYSDDLAPLAVRAHEARLAELLDSGHPTVALNYYRSRLEGFPGWQDLFSMQTLLRLDLEADGGALIGRYGTDPRVTRCIDEHIRERLADPRPLARHSGLPPEHPLKREAGLILEAFVEMEQEGPGERYEVMLREVGRRSPFVNWRLFVQALVAFYGQRDDDLAGALGRIPEQSAVRPMADVLADLAAGRPARTPVARKVERTAAGPDLRTALAEIDDLIAARRWTAYREAVTGVLKDRWLSDHPGLRIELGALCLFHYIEGGGPLRDDWPGLRTPNINEIVLRALSWAGNDDPEQWKILLEARRRQLSPLDQALICDRIAGSLIAQSAAVYPDFPMYRPGRSELRAAYRDAETYWKRSVYLAPRQEFYRNWSRAARNASATQAEKVHARWHDDFPEAEEPLLELVAACRRRRVLDKANRYFQRLAAFAAGRPAVEAVRHFLALDRAARHVLKGDAARAETELASIPEDAPLPAPVLTRLLRWRLAPNDQRRIDDLTRLNRPLHLLLLNPLIDGMSGKKGGSSPPLPAAVLDNLDQPDLLVGEYQRLSRCEDLSWRIRPGFHPLPMALLRAFETAAVPTDILRQCLEFIAGMAFDELLYPGCREMLWPLTANGIRRRDAGLPVFLAYRALLLDQPPPRPMSRIFGTRWIRNQERRVRQCLRAARQLADDTGNDSDIRIVRSIDEAITFDEYLPPEKRLTAAQIAAIVNAEAACAAEPDETVSPPPRRPGKTRKPREADDPAPAEDDRQDDLQMEMF